MGHSSAIREVVSVVVPPLVLSVVAAIGIGWACGGTLGVFIGSLLALTILIPPIVLAVDRFWDRLVAVTLLVVPLAVLWFMTARQTQTTVREWGASSVVLMAYGFALVGVARGFRAIRVSAVVSAALTVVIGLAWLTWPIWLSPAFNGEESAGWVNRLVAVHPGLSVSLPHLGQWENRIISYHLTSLSQDVSYAPPRTVWGCVGLHVFIAIGLIGLAEVYGPRDAKGTDADPVL